MSSQGITKKDSSPELDKVLLNVKGAAGIPLSSHSHSTIGLNPLQSNSILTEIDELRDEAQTSDEVLDGARDGAAEAPDDVSLSSLAPTSLAPNYHVVQLTKPLGIQFEENLEHQHTIGGAVVASIILGCSAAVDGSIRSGDQVVAVGKKRVSGMDFGEVMKLIEGSDNTVTLTLFRGRDPVESLISRQNSNLSKVSKSTKKSDPVAVEAPVEQTPLKDSQISKASHQSKASKKPSQTVLVFDPDSGNLKEWKQKKKVPFFFNSKKSKTKKSRPNNRSTKKGRFLWPKNKQSKAPPAAETTKAEICVVGENRTGIIHPLDAASIQSPVAESTPIDVKSPAPESTSIDTPAEFSLQVVAIVEVAKSESIEKEIDSTKDVQEVVNAPAPAVQLVKPTSDTKAAKGFDFDICSPAAIVGSVNFWIQQATEQESVYGSTNVENEKMINTIMARWLSAREEPKQSLNEEISADISQAVNLLKSQRTLIKELENDIKREEDIAKGSQRLKELTEENKARLMKELSDAKRLEKAAKELVHHLFNSLTAEDRLKAIHLSDDIAKAEKEAAEDDVVDFGRVQMEHVCSVKEEYDVAGFDDEGAFGDNVPVNNGRMPRSPSGISRVRSLSRARSKSTKEEH